MFPAGRRRTPVSPRALGLTGGIVLAVMVLGCLASMPYTFATPRADPTARRFEATDPDRTLLPPWWAPHAPDERSRVQAAADGRGRGPACHLGTDRLGRDLFIRCLAGGGISLLIGLAAAAFSVCIGTAYGTVAGFLGGRVDAVLMRMVDILYGLPSILLVVLLAVAADGLIERAGGEIGPGGRQLINLVTLLLAIGSVSWLTMARVIRGQVLSLKAQPFMEAARAIGLGWPRQFTRHLLPNLLGPIVVYATLTVPAAILSESFLSFLGIGVKEPLPSWGNLAADGLSELNTVRVRWWLLLWPCLFIGLTLLSLNFVGEAIRDRLDPKRRTASARLS